MNPLLIKIVFASLGAMAALLVYRSHHNNNNENKSKAGFQEGEPKTALCSICLKDFSNFSGRLNLPCGHPLHQACAKLLFVQRENSCPWCRRIINPEFLSEHFQKM